MKKRVPVLAVGAGGAAVLSQTFVATPNQPIFWAGVLLALCGGAALADAP